RAQGIDASISLEQPQVFFGETLASGSFDIAEWGFGIGVDPEQRGYFACHPAKGKKNPYRFCDRRLERLIDEGDRTISVAARSRLTRRFQAIIAEDLPLLPLYQHEDLVLLGAEVRGVVPNPQAGVAWNAERWWMQR
ncbi:MAG: extracellular solute-binding protein family 5, partial [Thermoleophilia bacterium]|nr:extracellular solute-binding protein family 5 [Thermoleophilia bacterium]